MQPIRLAIVTVSDAAHRGERADTSGSAIQTWAEREGHVVVERATIPDDRVRIRETLESLADGGAVDLIVTTGGTGLTARDITPEATRDVLHRSAPGIAEAIRAHGAESTDMAWLSRGVAGIRTASLIVNLPGSPSGVKDGLTVLDRFIGHAIQLLRGEDTGTHPTDG
jgi:molybdenum cofactor synthesis domain-containing protein